MKPDKNGERKHAAKLLILILAGSAFDSTNNIFV
jgi:hypothetical protein